jgi:alpha-amylase/alpha-mannosidase (GH57 family)
MHDIFGVKPTAFANTGLSYNNEIANIVADMGFRAILCEPTDKTVDCERARPSWPTRSIGRSAERAVPASWRCCLATRP